MIHIAKWTEHKLNSYITFLYNNDSNNNIDCHIFRLQKNALFMKQCIDGKKLK